MIDSGVYRMHFRGLSLGECWRLGRGPGGFCVALVLKAIGQKGNALWLPVWQSEVPCAWGELGLATQHRLWPVIEELRSLGYQQGFSIRMTRSVERGWREAGAYRALHEDGRRLIAANYTHIEANAAGRTVVQRGVRLYGLFMTDDLAAPVVITDHRSYMDNDEPSRRIFLRQGGPSGVAARLEQELRAYGGPVRTFANVEELNQAMAERTDRTFAGQIARGLYRRIPPDEEDRLLAEFGLGR